MSDMLIKFVSGKNNEPMVSSQEVALRFGKEHRNVLRALNEQVVPVVSDQFRRLNFEQSTYVNEQGKTQPEYKMTKDGFVILAMGFSGKEAMAWKERFIEAFNLALGSIVELKNELIRKEQVILRLQRKKQPRFLVPSKDHLEGFEPPLVPRLAEDLTSEEMAKAKQQHVVKTLTGIINKHIIERSKQEKAELLGALLITLCE
jgi:Rha family phage regulatory protein